MGAKRPIRLVLIYMKYNYFNTELLPQLYLPAIYFKWTVSEMSSKRPGKYENIDRFTRVPLKVLSDQV